MDITFRKALLEDYDTIMILLRDLYDHDDIDYETTKRIFGDRLLSNNNIGIVMMIDDKIIGYSHTIIVSDIQTQGSIGLLTEFVINANHRNKGHGKRLMDETINQCKENGCIELRLTSNFRRGDAHKFYEKNGFSKTAYLYWKTIE
ncbi:MAG: N-acetyltransferase family protein [Candidatus Woesearchaeota archaeon]